MRWCQDTLTLYRELERGGLLRHVNRTVVRALMDMHSVLTVHDVAEANALAGDLTEMLTIVAELRDTVTTLENELHWCKQCR